MTCWANDSELLFSLIFNYLQSFIFKLLIEIMLYFNVLYTFLVNKVLEN